MASGSSSFPSSSISSTSKWTYDVFLSFSGKDTRHTATDFVDYALVEKGIKVFKDDRNLERGKAIEPELFQAIKESKFAVVILSENYASSPWCLNELVEIITCEEKLGMTILPIFYNVNPSDVPNQKGTFDEYEKPFEQKVVGTWRDALTHVANIAGHHVDNSPLSEAVKSILGQISRKLSREFSEVTEGLVGIESPMLELESCLAFWLKDEVRFIGIWAMGGMGKTTLAEVAYKMFSKEFEACCFIDNVREKYEKEGELSLQKNLISQILNDTNLNIKNKCEGDRVIKSRLRGRRILLVLDDVNDLNQLQKLAGKREWFGRGSRVIVTTRDKHLLETNLIDEIYEVKALKYEDALHLFHSKAFENELVSGEYLKLSQRILEYVNGVPLALDILGSFLLGRSPNEWGDAIDTLREEPNEKVNQVLKISFDGLKKSEKEIFLDIACFFNHEKKDYVVQILKILGRRYPDIGLSILIEKSLLKIFENNYLWMHDLLLDMGRDIVCQESRDKPGKRSRLWHYEDIDNVLKNDTGTEKVQAMDIRGAEDTSIYHEEKDACWGWVLSALPWQGLALLVTLRGWVQKTLCWRGFTSSKKQKEPRWNANAFLKLSNLKFLRIHELVELHLLRSKIELLWGGMKIFGNLKSINMEGSSNLTITPNFNGVPNLEELVLARCLNLHKLHPSIGKLKKLKLLDLKECRELTSLPDMFEIESLVTLNLTHCLKVNKIPEFVGNMELLRELLLEGTAIVELPSSVEYLTGLNTLNLRNCKNLVCLPNTICRLTLLNNLDLYRCSKFDKLPRDLGNIVSLKKLCLRETAIKELPSSFEFLVGLTSLDLTDCKNFVLLPSTICSLKSLDKIILDGCSKFDKLPKDLGNITSLKELDLRETAVKELPSSIELLIGLTLLNLGNCKKFVLLPSTICSLKSLEKLLLNGCSKFDKLPEDLGNIVSLKKFSLGRTAIKELPSSFEFLTGLDTLFLNDCKELVLHPSILCSLKSLKVLCLSRCPKFVDLSMNFGNLKHVTWLVLEGTAIKVLPFSIGCLADLNYLTLRDCKNLMHLPSTICNLKRVWHFDLTGCLQIANLPENLGNMESLSELLLGGTAIKELPSSTIHLKQVLRSLSFKGCQLSSSSLTSMPRCHNTDLSDCNLSAIPSGINRILLTIPSGIEDLSTTILFLSGNNFVSLPESISQFSGLERLYLDGCKSLRSLPNIPSKVYFICLDNCTSLERLPEPPNNFTDQLKTKGNFIVQCFNCFKLAFNIRNFSNIFQGQSSQQFEKCYIIPGREIPSWFEKVNICDTSVVPYYSTYQLKKKVKTQLPGSGSGCDEWRGIVLCVVFFLTKSYRNVEIRVNGCQMHRFSNSFEFIKSEYGKVESHHLWLHSVSKNNLCLPKTPGCSIDKNGFHQVELEIKTRGLEVEKIGFCVV